MTSPELTEVWANGQVIRLHREEREELAVCTIHKERCTICICIFFGQGNRSLGSQMPDLADIPDLPFLGGSEASEYSQNIDVLRLTGKADWRGGGTYMNKPQPCRTHPGNGVASLCSEQ